MRGVDDILKNQLKCTDVSGIILPFNYDSKNDFSEIHILSSHWPRFPLCPIMGLG